MPDVTNPPKKNWRDRALHQPLSDTDENMVLANVAVGMDWRNLCWIFLKSDPARLVAHLKRSGNEGFALLFKQAEELGAKVDRFELYAQLLAQGYKSLIASRLCGIPGQLIVERRKHDLVYDHRIKEVEAGSFQSLETEAYRRAMEGSDRLMEFLLAAGDPKYRNLRGNQAPAEEPDKERTVDDKLEFAGRIAFALRKAAADGAAANQGSDGRDNRKPALDPPDRATN